MIKGFILCESKLNKKKKFWWYIKMSIRQILVNYCHWNKKILKTFLWVKKSTRKRRWRQAQAERTVWVRFSIKITWYIMTNKTLRISTLPKWKIRTRKKNTRISLKKSCWMIEYRKRHNILSIFCTPSREVIDKKRNNRIGRLRFNKMQIS